MPNANDFGLLSPTYTNITATTLIKTGIGRLRGIYVASTKSGAIEILDNVENAPPVMVREFNVAAGHYYKFGDVAFGTGLYVILKNTVDATIYYF